MRPRESEREREREISNLNAFRSGRPWDPTHKGRANLGQSPHITIIELGFTIDNFIAWKRIAFNAPPQKEIACRTYVSTSI